MTTIVHQLANIILQILQKRTLGYWEIKKRENILYRKRGTPKWIHTLGDMGSIFLNMERITILLHKDVSPTLCNPNNTVRLGNRDDHKTVWKSVSFGYVQTLTGQISTYTIRSRKNVHFCPVSERQVCLMIHHIQRSVIGRKKKYITPTHKRPCVCIQCVVF